MVIPGICCKLCISFFAKVQNVDGAWLSYCSTFEVQNVPFAMTKMKERNRFGVRLVLQFRRLD
jgi:hypothetical protein